MVLSLMIMGETNQFTFKMIRRSFYFKSKMGELMMNAEIVKEMQAIIEKVDANKDKFMRDWSILEDLRSIKFEFPDEKIIKGLGDFIKMGGDALWYENGEVTGPYLLLNGSGREIYGRRTPRIAKCGKGGYDIHYRYVPPFCRFYVFQIFFEEWFREWNRMKRNK